MVLDLRQNFVSAQYLWNRLSDFHAFIFTRSSLGLLHVKFRTFVLELWPFIFAKISFRLNIFDGDLLCTGCHILVVIVGSVE